MPDRGTQLEVVYSPAYGGGLLDGPGRWFQTEKGFVWTNDAGNLNLLDFGDYQAVQDFVTTKSIFHIKGMTASEAFDVLAESQIREIPETEVVAGSLKDLDAIFSDQSTPLTAAGQPTPYTYTYGITLDETGNVLELVQDGPEGFSVRQDRAWVPVDPEEADQDNGTVYGREWLDVTEAAITIFDGSQDVDFLSRAHFEPAILK